MLSLDPQLFLSVFAFIFVAEIPDKTAFATLILATRRNPFAIFIGVAAAFAIQSGVAIFFAQFFTFLNPHWIRYLSGITFLVMSLLMWRRKDSEPEINDQPVSARSFARDCIEAFIIIFLAEWGDLTQIATVAFEVRYRQPLTIFLASVAALWLVSALAIGVGKNLSLVMKPAAFRRAASLAFAAIGVFILAKSQ